MRSTWGKRVKRWFGPTLLGALGLAALAPWNMGGCSAEQVTTMVGGGLTAAKGLTLSDADEAVMGQNVALQISNTYPVTTDDALLEYVNLVGNTVAIKSNKDYDFVFGVVETPNVNAYSGPSGYIMVTRGALNQMQDESELAGVLAHECGHVIKQHGLKAARAAGATEGGATMLQGASQGQKWEAIGLYSSRAADLALNGYSVDQEAEADEVAAKILVGAGYDPEGLVRFIQRTQGTGPGQFGGTHPGGADRIASIRARIRKLGYAGNGATLPDRFQAAVTRK